jgi:hypothetical protein
MGLKSVTTNIGLGHAAGMLSCWPGQDSQGRDNMLIIYQAHGEIFTWRALAEDLQEVLREIGRDSAREECPITFNDSAYITRSLRELWAMFYPDQV